MPKGRNFLFYSTINGQLLAVRYDHSSREHLLGITFDAVDEFLEHTWRGVMVPASRTEEQAIDEKRGEPDGPLLLASDNR